MVIYHIKGLALLLLGSEVVRFMQVPDSVQLSNCVFVCKPVYPDLSHTEYHICMCVCLWVGVFSFPRPSGFEYPG